MVAAFDHVSRCYDSFMRFARLYHAEEILDALLLTGEERVVDLGGGTGHYARALAGHCREVAVVDESPAMLAKVPRHDRIRAVQADACRTGLPTAAFDVALLSDVMHHIPQQDQLLAEVHRLLTPHGRLVIHDFQANHPRARWLARCERVLFRQRLHYRTLPETAALCAQHRLTPLSAINQGWYFVLVGGKA